MTEPQAGQLWRREWRVPHHPNPPTFELETRQIIESIPDCSGGGGVYYEEMGRSVRRWVSMSEWNQWAEFSSLVDEQ